MSNVRLYFNENAPTKWRAPELRPRRSTFAPDNQRCVDLSLEPWEFDFTFPNWRSLSHDDLADIELVTTVRVRLDGTIYNFDCGVFQSGTTGRIPEAETDQPAMISVAARDGHYLISTVCKTLADHVRLWEYIIGGGSFTADRGYVRKSRT